MARRKDSRSGDVKQVAKTIKEIQRQSKKILKNAKKTSRQYRHELSVLKKQGIVAKWINARTHQPTRYMVKKIRKFRDVANETALSVPLQRMSPHRARQYVEKGMAERRGKYLVVPKTAAKQRADIYKGHLAITTSLKNGQETVIKLPYKINDMNDFVKALEDNESTINRIKGPKDQFGFQIGGHNSKIGFPDAERLRKELIEHYQHFFISPLASRKAYNEFVLIRFRNKWGNPTLDPYYGFKSYFGKKDHDRRRDYWIKRERQKRDTLQKQSRRKKETPEKKESRLSKQRQRDRTKANDRREKRMFNRLMDWEK